MSERMIDPHAASLDPPMRVRTHAQRQSHRASLQAQAAHHRRCEAANALQTKSLFAYVHGAAESERKRLANALHDELGGVLTSAKADLHWLRQSAGDDETVQQRFDRLAKAIDEAVAIERHAVESLRPSLLDHLGLGAALDWYIRGVAERSQLACRCGQVDPADAVPTDRAIIVYRLVQEAMANVLDAARSSRFELSIVRDDGGLRLHLEEDTDSFAEGLPMLHQQRLASMRQRAEALGGSLEVRRPGAGGTQIEVVFPATA